MSFCSSQKNIWTFNYCLVQSQNLHWVYNSFVTKTAEDISESA